MHLRPDGREGLALALEWLAKKVRAGDVSGISLEMSDEISRIGVSFHAEPEPEGPPVPGD
jgi:hypothetical protein